MILDAGFLISVDRDENIARVFLHTANTSGIPLHTTHPVVSQVWRNGSKQARLASFLKIITIHPFMDGKSVGRLLGQADSSDPVDAHLVALAMRLNDDILTGDPDDLGQLAATLGQHGPTIHSWP